MSGIRWLLAVLRRLILGNCLARASIRGLLFLFSALSRATKKKPAGDPHDDDGGGDLCPVLPPETVKRVGLISASFMPTSPHPRRRSTSSFFPVFGGPHLYGPHRSSYYSRVVFAAQPVCSAPTRHLVRPAATRRYCFGAAPSRITAVANPRLKWLPTSIQALLRSAWRYRSVIISLFERGRARIFPGTPETVERYSRKTIIPNDPTVFKLSPLTISVVPNPPPPGWTTCQHPEGVQYFFHEEKRVFTDANLFNNSTLIFINDNIRKVHDFLHAHNITVHLEPGVELVLDEYAYDDNSKGCRYYFVNHRYRCVFWMDNGDSDLFPVTHEVKGMTSASHIRHELEAQYWLHCEYYPRAFEVTHEIVDELRDIVLHAFGDIVTSQSSTLGWKVDDVKNMMKLTNGFSKNVDRVAGRKNSRSGCLVARLMHQFARLRVYHFHGEPGARLDIYQSVHGIVRRQTMLVKMLNPLLFYAPEFHLSSLHGVNTDGLIGRRGWSEFVVRLNSEWTECILYATVVLNANVAFLAIQSVDNSDGVVYRSPQQISSYLSMLTSIGSIFIGLLLVKHYRNQDRASALAVATSKHLGLEMLAIQYSLPYALLIWSMVSFFAAFSFLCFEKSSLLTRTLVAVVLTTVAVLIMWCVFDSWRQSSDWDWDWLPSWKSWLPGPAGHSQENEENEAQQGEAEAESEPKKRWWSVFWVPGQLMAGTPLDLLVLGQLPQTGPDEAALTALKTHVAEASTGGASALQVVMRFMPVGNTPVLKQNLFRLAATLPFQSVVSNLKKKLGMKVGDPLFAYYINSTFAPAPDEVLGNLYSVRLSVSNTNFWLA
ncbi:hypothetical protein B0H14DRAFT_3427700 [Mycena olivaceomarginata]|nr:hypothetical protein B0H14DRAFT_3427700 [Mycena olivaceomarginata]